MPGINQKACPNEPPRRRLVPLKLTTTPPLIFPVFFLIFFRHGESVTKMTARGEKVAEFLEKKLEINLGKKESKIFFACQVTSLCLLKTN